MELRIKFNDGPWTDSLSAEMLSALQKAELPVPFYFGVAGEEVADVTGIDIAGDREVVVVNAPAGGIALVPQYDVVDGSMVLTGFSIDLVEVLDVLAEDGEGVFVVTGDADED